MIEGNQACRICHKCGSGGLRTGGTQIQWSEISVAVRNHHGQRGGCRLAGDINAKQTVAFQTFNASRQFDRFGCRGFRHRCPVKRNARTGEGIIGFVLHTVQFIPVPHSVTGSLCLLISLTCFSRSSHTLSGSRLLALSIWDCFSFVTFVHWVSFPLVSHISERMVFRFLYLTYFT